VVIALAAAWGPDVAIAADRARPPVLKVAAGAEADRQACWFVSGPIRRARRRLLAAGPEGWCAGRGFGV
jgi:hypothetical protein